MQKTVYQAEIYKNFLKDVHTKRLTLLGKLESQKDNELVEYIERTLLDKKKHGQGFSWSSHDFSIFKTPGSKLRKTLEKARNAANKNSNFNLDDIILAAKTDPHNKDNCTPEVYLIRAENAEKENFNQLGVYYYIKYVETLLEKEVLNKQGFLSAIEKLQIIEDYLSISSSYYLQILEYRIAEKYADQLFLELKQLSTSALTHYAKLILNVFKTKNNEPLEENYENELPTNIQHMLQIKKAANITNNFWNVVSCIFTENITNYLNVAIYSCKEEILETVTSASIPGRKNSWKPTSIERRFLNNSVNFSSMKPELFKQEDYSLQHKHTENGTIKLYDAISHFENIKSLIEEQNKKPSFIARAIRWLKNILVSNCDNATNEEIQAFIKQHKQQSKPLSILEMVHTFEDTKAISKTNSNTTTINTERTSTKPQQNTSNNINNFRADFIIPTLRRL